MSDRDLTDLSVAEAADRVRRRKLSATELVRACLERIEAIEPAVQAWVVLDGERALRIASERDREAAAGQVRPLHGIPIGMKDIYLTRDFPTAAGFAPLAGHNPGKNAAVVDRLEAAGAIVLGKTVTTQWASGDPSKTLNPWNPGHTPGGSSSGSAAAVATRMVPAAIGSQTGGSVLRPAAYCGVVGLKPTYGRVSLRDVFPLAWSLDHPGPFARGVADVALLLQVMAGYDPEDPAAVDAPVGDYVGAAARPAERPRLGLLANWEPETQPAAWAHFRATADVLARAGAEVRELAFPGGVPAAAAIHLTTMTTEMAAVHAARFDAERTHYGPKIADFIATGRATTGAAYAEAQQRRRALGRAALALFSEVDCLITPTVSGPAPDRSTTGDMTFQAIWSLLGWPAITIPSGLSADGLPLGLQIVARPFAEEQLLRVARFAEQVLPPIGAPSVSARLLG